MLDEKLISKLFYFYLIDLFIHIPNRWGGSGGGSILGCSEAPLLPVGVGGLAWILLGIVGMGIATFRL